MRRFLIHKLVMMTFVGPCPDGYEVNHIDGDHKNNKLTNLEYVTKRRNYDHAIENGLHPRGDRHHGSKISEDGVRDIRRRLGEGEKGSKLAREYGLSSTWISMIKLNKVRKYVT